MSLEWTHMLAFNLAILGALVSPGPAFISMLRSALGENRRAGLQCALGLATAGTIWGILAVTGLTALFAVVPWAYTILKVGGAAYLGWLAFTLWRHANDPVDAGTTSRLSGFRLGLITNLANPKAVLFIAAIFTTVFPYMPTGVDAAVILLNHAALEMTWYAAIALVLTTDSARAIYTGAKVHIDRCAALILGALGLRLLMERG